MQGLAVTHLSVRVPWQDTRWDGRVCSDPSNNQACVVLKAIAENRRDATEQVNKHIRRTPVRVPKYGATLVPFRWLLPENAYDIAKELELDVSQDREPTEPAFLARTDWVQNHDNQQVLLDAFADRCVEGESLVFFYAKRTPLADDDRRVIVAVGLLAHKGKIDQYD
jgi:hypothetical protein